MCNSRKNPYPYHGGNCPTPLWNFRRKNTVFYGKKHLDPQENQVDCPPPTPLEFPIPSVGWDAHSCRVGWSTLRGWDAPQNNTRLNGVGCTWLWGGMFHRIPLRGGIYSATGWDVPKNTSRGWVVHSYMGGVFHRIA